MVTSGHSGIQPGHNINTSTIKWLPLGILVSNQDITQVQLNGYLWTFWYSPQVQLTQVQLNG